MQEQTQKPYSYWKKPWHPWLFLGAAVLQLAALGMSVRRYHQVAEAGVLSGAEWAAGAAQEQAQWACGGILAVSLLGTVLIGALVRSQQSARLAEGIFFLILALGWGISAVSLKLFSWNVTGFLTSLGLLLILGNAIWRLWSWRKNRKPHTVHKR